MLFVLFGIYLSIWAFTTASYYVCSMWISTKVCAALLLFNERDNIFSLSGMSSTSMNLLLHWISSLAILGHFIRGQLQGSRSRVQCGALAWHATCSVEREDLKLCKWNGVQGKRLEVSLCAVLGFLLIVWRVSADDPPLWILATSGMLTFKKQPKMSFLILQLGSILFCSLEYSCVHLSRRFRLALNSQFSCLSLLSAWITDVGQNIQFDQVFFYKILLSF